MPRTSAYPAAFKAVLIREYETTDISQRDLAAKHSVPFTTLVGWLTHKTNGLTPGQRYRRNRDKQLRLNHANVQFRLNQLRKERDSLGEKYGITKNRVSVIIKSKG